MKKIFFLLSFVVLHWAAIGQKKVIPTKLFSITGNVKMETSVTLQGLDTFKQTAVGDIAIKNHLGEAKFTIKNMKGILLKDILKTVEYTAETPKALSEYYFTCVASDGYMVVFSWNELYNTEIGNHVYIITEEDGKKAVANEDRIALISTSDINTGRRYVKCLSKIIVNRIP